MAKISELGPISGSNTRSNDLFVTVSLEQGDQGTKNITRKELVDAIQQETFDKLNVQNGAIIQSTILDSNLANFNILELPPLSESLSNDDFFVVKNVSTNSTEAITYSELQTELLETFSRANKIYVATDGFDIGEANGSYFKPFNTLEAAFAVAQESLTPVSISVLPGTYYTNGNLALPDYCSIVSTSGQYSTKIEMNTGYEEENCILVGSGSYVQGFAFDNLRVDDLDEPSKGFAVAFRPGALILRSPYIRDISQISNYRRQAIAAPLDPVNANP